MNQIKLSTRRHGFLVITLFVIINAMSCSNKSKTIVIDPNHLGIIEFYKNGTVEVMTAGIHTVDKLDRVYIYPFRDTIISSIKVTDKEHYNYVINFLTTFSVDIGQLKELHSNYKDTYKQLFVRILIEGKLRTASQEFQSNEINQEFIDSFLSNSFISSGDRPKTFSVESIDILSIEPLESAEFRIKRENPWYFAVLDTIYKTNFSGDIYCYKLTNDSGGNEGGDSQMRFITISKEGHKVDSLDFYLASWGEWSTRFSEVYFIQNMILITVTEGGYGTRNDSIRGTIITALPTEKQDFIFQVDRNLKFKETVATDEILNQFKKLERIEQ